MAQSSKSNTVIFTISATVVALLSIYLIYGLSHSRLFIDNDKSKAEAVAARVKPLGLSVAGSPVGSRTGQEIYSKACISCHGAGLAGAPKFEDAAAWAPRLAKGRATLISHAINGFNGMPARGNLPDLTDQEVARAVDYLSSGGTIITNDSNATAAPMVTTELSKGKEIYDSVCFACHATGVANAPKFGNKADWTACLKKGDAALLASATKGLNAMPPKGSYSGSDDEFKLAVDYMLAAVK